MWRGNTRTSHTIYFAIAFATLAIGILFAFRLLEKLLQPKK